MEKKKRNENPPTPIFLGVHHPSLAFDQPYLVIETVVGILMGATYRLNWLMEVM
jgi:hypothetical protein